MIVVSMMAQEAGCLISPLALRKAPKDYALEFKRPFDQVVVQALFNISEEPIQEVVDGSEFKLIAGIQIVEVAERIETPQGKTQAYRRWLQLRGDYLSLWICHALRDGEATYWYHSHLRLTIVEFSKLRELYTLEGAEAIEATIAHGLQSVLWKRVDAIEAFVRIMMRSGTRERILT